MLSLHRRGLALWLRRPRLWGGGGGKKDKETTTTEIPTVDPFFTMHCPEVDCEGGVVAIPLDNIGGCFDCPAGPFPGTLPQTLQDCLDEAGITDCATLSGANCELPIDGPVGSECTSSCRCHPESVKSGTCDDCCSCRESVNIGNAYPDLAGVDLACLRPSTLSGFDCPTSPCEWLPDSSCDQASTASFAAAGPHDREYIIDPAMSTLTLTTLGETAVFPVSGGANGDSATNSIMGLVAWVSDGAFLGKATEGWAFWITSDVVYAATPPSSTIEIYHTSAPVLIGQGRFGGVAYELNSHLNVDATGTIDLSTMTWSLQYSEETGINSLDLHLEGPFNDAF